MIGEERWKPMYQILLVDDDPHILEVNAAYLKQQGYQVFCARDGRSALSIAKSAALDGVILDVDMPGLDGVTVCQRLREMSGVPVLFLSAYVKADDRIRGLLAGGDDYLAKPYSLVELELRLRLRIEGRQRFSRQEVLRFGELEIDLGLREVRFGRSRRPSPRWSLTCWPSWLSTPVRCSPMPSSPTRSGAPPSTRGCTTSRCVWRGCAKSWTPCAPDSTISRPSGARATASRQNNGAPLYGAPAFTARACACEEAKP